MSVIGEFSLVCLCVRKFVCACVRACCLCMRTCMAFSFSYRLGPFLADAALANGLVDGLAYGVDLYSGSGYVALTNTLQKMQNL